ncbi:MAG TPA: hypothetical protein VGD58_10630 [Herpetosiphonaceae bacterium]
MSILHQLRSHVRRSVLFIVAAAILLSTLTNSSATTSAAPMMANISCSPSGPNQVNVLDTNGYVFQYIDSSSGTGVNRLYTAPAGRGFRSYTDCDRPVNGRWWTYGHSAVDGRNGWILLCHLYWEVPC